MDLEKAVLATLAYHDIFQYPLKEEEILNYLIGKKASNNEVRKAINNLLKKKKISESKNYYFLKAREATINIRIKRTKFSRRKLKNANFYTNILKFIPTVKSVCLTGALSMENSEKNDDIDLLIICQKKTLWTTRFLANIMLFPYKRKPNSLNNSNKACLNIFLDESNLKIKAQNLYTAHEICQLKVLWAKNNVYQRFLNSNLWIKKYLPNWRADILSKSAKSRGVFERTLITTLISKLEKILKVFQLKYMQSKITTEKIGDRQLFFHPRNTQEIILKEYAKKISNL